MPLYIHLLYIYTNRISAFRPDRHRLLNKIRIFFRIFIYLLLQSGLEKTRTICDDDH